MLQSREVVAGFFFLAYVMAPVAVSATEGQPVGPGYGPLRLGMTEKDAKSARQMSCGPVTGQFRLCKGSPVARTGEKKLEAWFFEKRLALITVDFAENHKALHREFLKPYMSVFGEPDKEQSVPVQFEPPGGWVNTSTWLDAAGAMIAVTSWKKRLSDESQGFTLTVVDNQNAETVFEAVLEHQRKHSPRKR